MKITLEFQKTIQNKIEAAFIAGYGDNFMQKNNFRQIICVKPYEIEAMQSVGFDLFFLADYRRNITEPTHVKIEATIQPKIEENKNDGVVKRNRFREYEYMSYSDADPGL